jgi:hypothetical protein
VLDAPGFPAGDDHETAQNEGVGDVPSGGQGELTIVKITPDGDRGGEQQKDKDQYLRNHEVER